MATPETGLYSRACLANSYWYSHSKLLLYTNSHFRYASGVTGSKKLAHPHFFEDLDTSQKDAIFFIAAQTALSANPAT